LLSSTLKIISQGIDKSTQLLKLAEADDWDAFHELEAERQSDFTSLQLGKLNNLTDAQHAEVQKQMAMLVDLNQQLEEVCREQRSDLSDQMKKFTQGNKAKKAYSQ
jgi:Fe-S cluster biosynthesis and repair protein YggX